MCQLPTKRPLHQPFAQPLDLHTRCHLLLTNPLHILYDTGELLLEGEWGKGIFNLILFYEIQSMTINFMFDDFKWGKSKKFRGIYFLTGYLLGFH